MDLDVLGKAKKLHQMRVRKLGKLYSDLEKGLFHERRNQKVTKAA